MQCSVCTKSFSSRRRPSCASCAQAILYQSRLEQAAALLNREKSHSHALAVVRPGNDGVIAALPEDADWDAITTAIKTHGVHQNRTEISALEAQIEHIITKSDELRLQIEECRSYLTKQREANEQRRRVLSEERKQLQARRSALIDPLRSACRKTNRTLDKVHSRTAEARECLCREAASLGGLKRVRGASGHYEYRLNGLVVPDLRHLNGFSGRLGADAIDVSSAAKSVVENHEIVSTSFDNVCRLLGVCCYYLSVRPQAEILLPHSDFPHAMVLQERVSYRLDDNGRQNLEASQSNSTTLRRRREVPNSRQLQIDRPLPKLLQESQSTYERFLEGVMWLAWDVAWLCRTQNVPGIDTFEDVCAIGKNLHTLFASNDARPSLRNNVTRNLTSTSKVETTDKNNNNNKSTASDMVATRFGMLSHNSARNSLAGHTGARLRDGWRLESSSPNRLFDRLRNFLVDEARRAEWTFIDDAEWDEDLEHERPVLVGGNRRSTTGPATSIISVAAIDADKERDVGAEKPKGGWMKVRGRVENG